MATFILILLLAFVVAMAIPDSQYDLEKADEYFQAFLKKYKKHYPNEVVKAQKFEAFKESLKRYNVQNSEQLNAIFGVDEDSDLTIEEFTKSRFGYLPTSDSEKKCTLFPVPPANPPQEYDWQKRHYVTDVKRQGCGDSWAFSATGNIESQYIKRYQVKLSFSEQQLVDCDKTNGGCDGGAMIKAYNALMNITGQMSDYDYKYKGKAEQCAFDKERNKLKFRFDVKVTGCNRYIIDMTHEEDLVKVLYEQGPLSVALDASSWNGYLGGILNTCTSDKANHGVLLVGYGVQKNITFWRFKNSWGKHWGEDGYIRLERGKNLCGLLSDEVASATIEKIKRNYSFFYHTPEIPPHLPHLPLL